jgi:hypothetical protein
VLRTARITRDAEQAAGKAATASPRTGYLAILRDRKYLVYLLLMLVNGLIHIQFCAVLPVMLLAEPYHTWAYASLNAVAAILGFALQLRVTKVTQNWPIWLAVMGGWVLLVIGRAALGLPGGLLWTHIGKEVWLVCLVVGLAITGLGVWSLRPQAPADQLAPETPGVR